MMRVACAIVAGLTFVSTTHDLLSQNTQNAIDVHGALGGAATGGGGADNGGAFARLGMGIRMASTWTLNFDGPLKRDQCGSADGTVRIAIHISECSKGCRRLHGTDADRA
jgi:hypothetical protein